MKDRARVVPTHAVPSVLVIGGSPLYHDSKSGAWAAISISQACEQERQLEIGTELARKPEDAKSNLMPLLVL